jgi:hypothetical protein
MSELAHFRKNEIISMLSYSDELISDISNMHNNLLTGSGEMLKFQIYIKFFLELMFSCLDYLAMDLCYQYGGRTNEHRIAFPIIDYIENEEMIDSEKKLIVQTKNKINENASKDLSLVHKIRNYQHVHYQNNNIWLTDFKKLRNKNTHRNLSIYEERLDSDRILYGPGGQSIVFKGMNSGINILGDKSYTSKSELEKLFGAKVTEKNKKYYIFTDVHPVNQESIKFLKEIRRNVATIIDEMYVFLENNSRPNN